MKTIMNLDTQDSFYESNNPWSPDSGVYASSPGSSTSGMTPQSEIHGQQFSPYTQNVYWTPTGEDGRPFMSIVEEPHSMFRFRYQSEMHGTHGSLMGSSFEKSNKTKKTFPTVVLRNYMGHEAYIRCTLFQVEREGTKYRYPHSHKLVIKKSGADEQCDPHVMKVTRDVGFQAAFQGMGIIHTAKKDIFDELVPKMMRLEEYELQRDLTDLEVEKIKKKAKEEAKSMNLNQACLCFQAFGLDGGKWQPICEPVYSQAINNIKSALTGELKICRVSTNVSTSMGGQEVYLLVEKVNKSDIKVRFFERDHDGNVVWEKTAKVLDVHHQYAIVLETPAYHNPTIDQPVDVFMELYREKDLCRSKAWPFKYKPAENVIHSRKRPKRDSSHMDDLPTVLYSPASTPEFDLNLGQGLSREEENELMRILEEKMNEVRTIPDLGASDLFGAATSLDIDSSGPSKVPAARSDQVKKLSGYLYFKMMVILIQKYGTQEDFDRVRDKVAKIFHHANKKGENFFFSAIEQGNRLVLRKILQVLRDYHLEELLNIYNDDNETCLHIASTYNRASYLRLLIEMGADPNHVDSKGNTPLHVCVLERKLECLIRILETKSTLKLDIENFDGYTGLHLAVKTNQLAFIKHLLDAGASPYTTDAKTGDTILHTAIEQHSLEIVEFIVENCTDTDLINTVNHSDHYPIQCITEDSDEDELRIAKYLLKKGAVCKNVTVDVLDKIKNVSDAPVFKVPDVPIGVATVAAAPTFDIPKETLDVLEAHREVQNPIKFDRIAQAALVEVLKIDSRWKELALLLEFTSLVEVWESTRNPVKCLLEYIEGSKTVDTEQLSSLFQALGIDEAIQVVDSMIARQYKD